LADCKLGGYFIPKNTVVLCNIGAVMRDPTHFKDPENFDPQRFLCTDKNGKLNFTPHPKYDSSTILNR